MNTVYGLQIPVQLCLERFRLVSSVGRASDSRPEGREFKSLTGHFLSVQLRIKRLLVPTTRATRTMMEVLIGHCENLSTHETQMR